MVETVAFHRFGAAFRPSLPAACHGPRLCAGTTRAARFRTRLLALCVGPRLPHSLVSPPFSPCFAMPEFISVENVRISLLPATLVRRFGAILIDIISVFTVIMIGGTTFGMLISSWDRIWLPVAVLVLLLLPAIEEVIFDGRTLGKLCLGLRVVQIDGSAPTVWALLLRYFLLWLDVFGSFGTGLLLMFGTKLHRRWGDMAAGTFVAQRDRQNSARSPAQFFCRSAQLHPHFCAHRPHRCPPCRTHLACAGRCLHAHRHIRGLRFRTAGRSRGGWALARGRRPALSLRSALCLSPRRLILAALPAFVPLHRDRRSFATAFTVFFVCGGDYKIFVFFNQKQIASK